MLTFRAISKVKTTSAAVSSLPSDQVVPSCSGTVSVCRSVSCSSLPSPGCSDPSMRLKRSSVS